MAPARTIAYTAVSFVGPELLVVRGSGAQRWDGAAQSGRAEARRGSILRTRVAHRKMRARGPDQRLRVPFFLIGTCSTWGSSSWESPGAGVAPGSVLPVPGSTTPCRGGAPMLPTRPGARPVSGVVSVGWAAVGEAAGRAARRPRVRVVTVGAGASSATGVSTGSTTTVGSVTEPPSATAAGSGAAAGRLAERRARVRVVTFGAAGSCGSGVSTGSTAGDG